MKKPSANDELAALVAAQNSAGDDPTSDTDSPKVNVVALRAGGRWYAVPVQWVREVVTKDYITRIPSAPKHLLGVILVHGRLVPVVSLADLIGKTETKEAAGTLPRVVIAAVGDRELGIVADEAHGPIEMDAPRGLSQEDHIEGEVTWSERLVCVLNADHLITRAMEHGRV